VQKGETQLNSAEPSAVQVVDSPAFLEEPEVSGGFKLVDKK